MASRPPCCSLQHCAIPGTPAGNRFPDLAASALPRAAYTVRNQLTGESFMRSDRPSALLPRILTGALATAIVSAASASSHREAPFITTKPKADGTDFYMFNSYEPGRTGFVTIIANYQGLQEPQAGPNYYTMDPNALYEISIDNNGDGVEDLTFQFRFTTTTQGLAVMAGTKSIPVPLSNIGPLSATSYATQNVYETYT